MIKAVIFDMDGVLIEAKDWHYDALNRALRLFGFEISRYAHLTTYDGLPTSKKLEMLSLESGLPRELHGFINEMKQAYTMELVHSLCKPRFVHEYALSKLSAMNYKLAVASNSIRQTMEVMLKKARLDVYLDHVMSASDVTQGKPSPEIYLKTIERLGFEPHECLIVEDNENGIRAATAAGAHVLAVREVEDVNISNILNRIRQVNEEALA
ncbi:Phosphorylated carbohydrates phosphatase [Burkholderia sp. AD24]|uniref:HAD family hydrolase n=1 Tax=Paraburkholderia sp. BL21I4N1 TaxID=1938801 RepID=UPI000B60F313|nr:HAD family phosphatase [Paraburkholderia sp. BL21I4N1]ASL48453.1 Phosphorylated carbohydrates phosphatase [Burkholderia sp. AD24]PQV49075.1 HAD superfamily hydrolase (TIGR01493 family)/HAD superfamily hydrolase (TIGR01509 family)/HAD superfamily hydrolase (TIGR01549 family) [Paraburkholderia sp. BL21I4N1]